jgi:hypothetical protein
MDATYFLKNRTQFIRTFYTRGVEPFIAVKHAIEEERPPFHDPPYSQDPEPAYLTEWLEADTAVKLLGLSCVSLLSDTLKLYFQTLERRVISFDFKDRKKAFRLGFVAAYVGVLGPILQTDWSDCPADLAVIEQIVLARNEGQHPTSLGSFDVSHDPSVLKKHPRPFFISEDECRIWEESGEPRPSLLAPSVEVTAGSLFAAIGHVEKLAEWIESRLGHAWEWRRKAESAPDGP